MLRCLSSSLLFFPVSLYFSLLRSSLSRVPLKDIHERRTALGERERAWKHRSLLLCVRLSFAALSFWSSFCGNKFPPSVWLDLYTVCVSVCVSGCSALAAFLGNYFGGKTMQKSMHVLWNCKCFLLLFNKSDIDWGIISNSDIIVWEHTSVFPTLVNEFIHQWNDTLRHAGAEGSIHRAGHCLNWLAD